MKVNELGLCEEQVDAAKGDQWCGSDVESRGEDQSIFVDPSVSAK